MKKFSSFYKNHRGFTLVELMIVIAIIGILAAVLYPSLTGYLERTRDTNRTKALANIQLALATYQSDNEGYPKADATQTPSCVADIADILNPASGQKYLPVLPKDPKNGNGVEGCVRGSDAKETGFWYKILKWDKGYVLAAKMENISKGNITEEKYGQLTDAADSTTASAAEAVKDKVPLNTSIGQSYYAVFN